MANEPVAPPDDMVGPPLPARHHTPVAQQPTVAKSTSEPESVLNTVGAGSQGLLAGLTGGLSNPALAAADGTGMGFGSKGIVEGRKEHPAYQLGDKVGSFLRDTAAAALVGPMAWYGNAALNTAGQAADEAYNHDPRLTVEHVGRIAAGQAVGAAVAHLGGVGLESLSAGGKLIMSAAAKKAGQVISSVGGSRVARYLSGGTLEELGEKAVQQNVFSQSRAAATKTVQAVIKKVAQDKDAMLAHADEVAGLAPPPAQAMDYLHTTMANLEYELGLTKIGNAGIKKLRKNLPGDPLPSELEMLRQRLVDESGKAMRKNDGLAIGKITQARASVETVLDHMLETVGVAPAHIHELRNQLQAQYTVLAGIPKHTLDWKTLVRGGAGIAAGAGTRAAAKSVGAPEWAADAAGLAAGAAVGGAGSSTKPTMAGIVKTGVSLAQSAKGRLAEGVYKAGKSMSEVDTGAFATFIAQTMDREIDKAANAVVGGTFHQAVLPHTDEILHAVTGWAQNPETYRFNVAKHLDDHPLPQSYKDAGAAKVEDLFGVLQQHLPAKATSPNPLAPPAARELSSQESYTLRRAAHGAFNPLGELKDPTPTGVAVVKQLHPALYENFVQKVMGHMGPNSPATHPARRVLEQLGADLSVRRAGAIVQQLYKAQPAPPPGAEKSHHTTQNVTKISNVTNSPTHNEAVQQDK